MVERWFAQGTQACFVGAYECVGQFSETDFSEDLRKMDFPVLFLHRDDDQVVPIEAAAKKAVKLLPRGRSRCILAGRMRCLMCLLRR